MQAIVRAARIHLPNAVEKMALDRFHVAKKLGEVADKTRQNEHPYFPVESCRLAKGNRFLWQYSDKWMAECLQEKLIWLCADETDEPLLGAERTGKGYLDQPSSEERRNDRYMVY
ncbi:transposase [Escherichia coli M114]|nr:transposase [Escherichia coli M114]